MRTSGSVNPEAPSRNHVPVEQVLCASAMSTSGDLLSGESPCSTLFTSSGAHPQLMQNVPTKTRPLPGVLSVRCYIQFYDHVKISLGVCVPCSVASGHSVVTKPFLDRAYARLADGFNYNVPVISRKQTPSCLKEHSPD